MRACLTYHAEAVPRESNPSPRLLTDKGRADARRLGLFLKEDGMGNARVLHNGTTWIQENAEILGQALGGGDGERIEKPLYPLNAGADIEPLIRDLNAAEDDIDAALPSDVTFRTVTQLIAGRESPLAVSMELPGHSALIEDAASSGPGTVNATFNAAAGDRTAQPSSHLAKQGCRT
jgi:hypothetical protein